MKGEIHQSHVSFLQKFSIISFLLPCRFLANIQLISLHLSSSSSHLIFIFIKPSSFNKISSIQGTNLAKLHLEEVGTPPFSCFCLTWGCLRLPLLPLFWCYIGWIWWIRVGLRYDWVRIEDLMDWFKENISLRSCWGFSLDSPYGGVYGSAYSRLNLMNPFLYETRYSGLSIHINYKVLD